MGSKDADGIAISVDPDQTAPLGVYTISSNEKLSTFTVTVFYAYCDWPAAMIVLASYTNNMVKT